MCVITHRNQISNVFFIFQITKIQAPNSEHGNKQRERCNGDNGHRTAPRPIPTVQRAVSTATRTFYGQIGARSFTRPLGRQTVRGGI